MLSLYVPLPDGLELQFVHLEPHRGSCRLPGRNVQINLYVSWNRSGFRVAHHDPLTSNEYLKHNNKQNLGLYTSPLFLTFPSTHRRCTLFCCIPHSPKSPQLVLSSYRVSTTIGCSPDYMYKRALANFVENTIR